MVIADGSIRSGKTIACICSFLTWSMENYQGQAFILAGKTIGALKKNVVRPMLQILTAWGLTYDYVRSGEQYIEVGSNIYYLYDAHNEASQDKLQGLTAAGAYADEAALFPRNFVEQMIGRCSEDGAKVWMNCNPGSPNHYLLVEYIQKAKEKKIYHLHFMLEDNLTLSPATRERYRRMYTGIFYKRYILGLWCLAEGLVYDFDSVRHTTSDIPESGRYFISVDYGTQNPFSAGLWCYDGKRAVRIREYYHDGRGTGRQMTDEEYYTELEKLAGDLLIERVTVDPSAASFITVIRKHGRFTVRRARNDVLDGIRRTAEMLRTGRILIHKDCADTIREFGLYVWDEKATDDRPIKANDHAMDDIRYFCNTIMTRLG